MARTNPIGNKFATQDFYAGKQVALKLTSNGLEAQPGFGGFKAPAGQVYVPRVGTWQPIAATSGSDTACSATVTNVGSIFVPMNGVVTGIQYLIGSVGGTDTVIAILYDSTGTPVAQSAAATVGTAANLQQLALTAPYSIKGPGLYYIGLMFSGATAKVRTVPAHCQAGSGLVASGPTTVYNTVGVITPPTTFTADKSPVASLY